MTQVSVRKKIGLIINSLGSGGAQRQIVILAAGLAARGHDVHLFYYDGDSHMKNDLSNSNVELHSAKEQTASKIRRWAETISNIRKVNPSHLISFIEGPSYLSFIYKLLFSHDLYWIAGERNFDLDAKLSWRIKKTIAYYLANKVVANSVAQRGLLVDKLNYYAEKIKYIPNAVNPLLLGKPKPNFARRSAGAKLNITCLARLSKQKNPLLLIDALALLDEVTRAKIHITWYGHEEEGGHSRAELNGKASAAALPITFVKSATEVKKLLASSDALILCSLYEGTPNAVLEAMASGAMVIASAVSDTSHIIGNNERGLLFSSGNAQDLADSIKSLVGMPEDKWVATISRAYQYVVTEYEESRMIDRYEHELDI